MAEIALQGVSKTYNPGLFKKKVRAVSDLSLGVDRGEVFGLIGPNGAGKSTTIRLLLGLIRPDSGVVTFRGKRLAETGIQKEIGYLPENPYLYDHLTLDEVLTFAGRASGLSSPDIIRRTKELTARLDLVDAHKRPLRTFSKGMLQRAGICFALLHDPTVVILDEPMSGLDPIGRGMVFDLVLELKGRGKTIFFCSHILSDVERLCDRIGMMVGGRLVREYQKQEFWQGTENLVHLAIPGLTVEQRAQVGQLIEGMVDEGETCVVSVSPARLKGVADLLSAWGVEPCGSRAERFSLERFFLKAVEEQKQ